MRSGVICDYCELKDICCDSCRKYNKFVGKEVRTHYGHFLPIKVRSGKEWINCFQYSCCSLIATDNKANYCPRCGAKMSMSRRVRRGVL